MSAVEECAFALPSGAARPPSPGPPPSVTIGADHAVPLPPWLSALPAKRALFAADSYFRDGWEDLLAVAGARAPTLLHRHGILLLKPDAVAGRRLGPALDWLLEQDAVVVSARRLRIDRHSARAMWWYQWNVATADRRELADRLVRAGECLLLVVRLPDAPVPTTVRLADRKGPADPVRRRPRQLRHRLGGDTFLVNFVHTADEPADLVRELGILLDGPGRRAVLRDMLDGTDRQTAAEAHIGSLYRDHAAHDLTLDGLLGRLEAAGEAGRRLAARVREGAPQDWRSMLAAADRAGAALGYWQRIVLGTHLMAHSVPDRVPLLSGVTAAQWEAAAAEPQPSDEWKVPPRLVHKSGTDEVFVTGHLRAGRRRVLVTGELPTAHRYFCDLPAAMPYPDLTAILELCRQCCYVLAHAHYGAPAGDRFVLRALRGELTAGAGLRESWPAEPWRVCVDVSVTRVWERAGRVTGLKLDYLVHDSAGSVVATACSSFSWMSAARWCAFREGVRAAHGLPAAVATPGHEGVFPSPGLVGRGLACNVVVADPSVTAGRTRARVVVDPGNTAMFEHAQDHVPGMVQMEAARQVALWQFTETTGVPPGDVTVHGLDTAFLAVAELDLPLLATAGRTGPAEVAVELTQAGTPVARAAVVLHHRRSGGEAAS